VRDAIASPGPGRGLAVLQRGGGRNGGWIGPGGRRGGRADGRADGRVHGRARVLDRMVAQLEDSAPAAVHRGYACDVCALAPIRGVRFRCKVCADFDVCSECMNDAQEVVEAHAEHAFERWSQVEEVSPTQSERDGGARCGSALRRNRPAASPSPARAAAPLLSESLRERIAANRHAAQLKLAAKHAARRSAPPPPASRFDLGIDESSSEEEEAAAAAPLLPLPLPPLPAAPLPPPPLILSKRSLRINAKLRDNTSVRLARLDIDCGADLIVSRRTAVVVERAASVNSAKKLKRVVERLSELGALYERVVIIVEVARSDGRHDGASGNGEVRPAAHCALLELGYVRLLTSSGDASTAALVVELALHGARAGVALDFSRAFIDAAGDAAGGDGRVAATMRFLCSCHLGTAAALRCLAGGSVADALRARDGGDSDTSCFARYAARSIDARFFHGGSR
jgi:hypothetical protein